MNVRNIFQITAVTALLALLGCVHGAIPPRAQPSAARIGIVVEKDALLALGIEEEVAAGLRQKILESRAGVPVADGGQGDLLLKVLINSANFTAATQWEWQLIDVDSGAIVLSKSESSPFGASGDAIAHEIALALSELDTAPYAGPGAVAVQPAQPLGGGGVALEPPASATDGSQSWAVVIGVESYREQLAPATGAEKDAQAFAAYARETLGVPEANIKLLVGQRATRADVTGALLEWLPRNAASPGGRVYVFFSGHGAPDVETGDAYLVPYDANPTYLKTGGVALRELQGALGALKGQEVYVFLDACFSGSGDRSVLAAGTRPLVPVKVPPVAGGVVTFSAAAATETTGAHPTSGHGLFTHHLLEGLGGAADANQDRDISLAELKAHITSKVQLDARRQNRDQTPGVAAPAGLDLQRAVLVRQLKP